MGGLAKISEGTLHQGQGARLEPFGQHVLGGASEIGFGLLDVHANAIKT